MTPGKSLVGSISRSTSTPEVYVGLSWGYGKRNSSPDVSNVAITFWAAGGWFGEISCNSSTYNGWCSSVAWSWWRVATPIYHIIIF